MGIDIGPRVYLSAFSYGKTWEQKLTLGFTGLEEDIRDDLVNLSNKLEQWVIGQVLQGEFSLSSVSRIGLSEDGMSVTWNDLSTL